MKILKCFCILLTVFLVFNAEKANAQFVPFQSGHFKHLTTDTLYNLTGNGTPTTTPNSYKRIVWYYDSTNDRNFYWAPQMHEWVYQSPGNVFISSDTSFTLDGTVLTVTIPHGQGATPRMVDVSVDNPDGGGFTASFDDANVYISYLIAPIGTFTYTLSILPPIFLP